jgi:two-component system phosphate regulon response regulator PhoB
MSTIAVVEDEENVMKYVCINLEARGYSTLQARSVQAGVNVIREGRPDLILLDYILGADTGEAVLQAISQDPSLRNIPVIVMSASIDRALQDFDIYDNVEDVLHKPMTVDALNSAITRALRQHSTGE